MGWPPGIAGPDVAGWADGLHAGADAGAGWTDGVHAGADAPAGWADGDHAGADAGAGWTNGVHAGADAPAGWADGVHAGADSDVGADGLPPDVAGSTGVAGAGEDGAPDAAASDATASEGPGTGEDGAPDAAAGEIAAGSPVGDESVEVVLPAIVLPVALSVVDPPPVNVGSAPDALDADSSGAADSAAPESGGLGLSAMPDPPFPGTEFASRHSLHARRTRASGRDSSGRTASREP